MNIQVGDSIFELEHIKWGYTHYKSIPANFRILIEWTDNGEGVFMPKRLPWRDFWNKYANKFDGNNAILTPEELQYKM